MRPRRTVASIAITSILVAGAPAVVHADDGGGAPPPSEPAPTTTIQIDIPVAAPPDDVADAPEVEPADDPPPAAAEDAPTAEEPAPTTTIAPEASADPADHTAGGAGAANGDAPADDEAPDDGDAPAPVPETPTPTTNAQHTAEQATVITGTQVAVADTGGNATVDEQHPTGGGGVAPVGGAVDTGRADAIGSRDENTVVQQADVVLTGDAVANLLQIALILNIGAALANSGANGVVSTPGGSSNPGQIATGSATAVGNDVGAYLTQAVNAEATSAVDDDASQLAVSMFLGLAVANSGANSVTGNGAAGSGGAIGTGDAQAIGNDSITEITQQAILLGGDAAEINVIQRATVLNLGFAVANSGLNDISGVAGSLLAASDDEDDQLAQQLFAMLLPALLSSYGYGAGSGSVAAGDATAVGNRSETYVQQVVGAAASGDGVVNVVQDALVANVGGAVANSGLNALGSGRELDPATASAVVQMAAFLANILARVHHSSDAASTLAATDESIEIPFGDLLLTLNGTLGGIDTELSSGGSRANIRQISVVISLGIAEANSGRNAVGTVSSTQLLAAVNSVLPDVITTGDADARNAAIVQICQRINAADVECLAPPDPVDPVDPAGPTDPVLPAAIDEPTTIVVIDVAPTPATATRPQGLRSASARAVPSSLAATGSETQGLLVVSGSLVLAGGAMVLLTRRRRGAPSA
jgi:LPXTG-motif cell wall-anchored protein